MMSRFCRLSVLAVMFAICANAADKEQVTSFTLPRPKTDGASQLDLWATNYYVYLATQSEGGIPLLDAAGHPLGPVLSAKDWCLGGIEGTIKVGDTTYNFDRTKPPPQVNCKKVVKFNVGSNRYAKAKGPFGDGVKGFGLVPWRSLATDPNTIPTGTVLFIPDAVGTKLPGGLVHDGYFFAADVGSHIDANHIDVFTGTSEEPVLRFVRSSQDKQFKAFIVPDASIMQAFSDLHTRWIFGQP